MSITLPRIDKRFAAVAGIDGRVRLRVSQAATVRIVLTMPRVTVL